MANPRLVLRRPQPVAARPTDVLRRLLECTPQPLSPPVLHPEFHSMPPITRVVEVLRYSVARGEYAVSPNGALRAWAVLNLRLALFAVLPLLLVVPIITAFLTSVKAWTALVVAILTNILIALLLLIAIGVILTILMLALSGRRGRPRG